MPFLLFDLSGVATLNRESCAERIVYTGPFCSHEDFASLNNILRHAKNIPFSQFLWGLYCSNVYSSGLCNRFETRREH